MYSHFIAKVLEEGGTDPEKTISYLDDAIIGTKDNRELQFWKLTDEQGLS